jgi:beta-glucosidase
MDAEAPAPSEPAATLASAGAPQPHVREGLVEPGIHAANFRFPRGFLWGAATSAHQVEGGNTLNDWWAWEQEGRVATPSGAAADHFRRFREDFDLARALEHNAHRFSLEWSRIEPEEGRFDDAAIAHYGEVIATLRALGIEPVVTLFHYTLPQWLAARSGWENPRIEHYFNRYVERVVHAYGPLVRWWLTLNEPVVQVFKGWLIGQWPPGKSQDYPAALKVLRHMLRAHVQAYHTLHRHRPDAMVSIAKHALALTACDPRSWRDRSSTWIRGYLFNHLFVDALHTGALRVPGLFWERLPMARTLDFIGVNYYTRDFVRNTGLDLPGFVGGVCNLDQQRFVGKLNDLGWEVYPEGLAQFLREYRRYRLPILITENGIPARDDEDRWTFLYLHLWQVARAIADGVPVAGYLHWSLLDNFEWADGYAARFGLIEVDFATQRRRVRPSAWRFAHIIRTGEL